MVQKNKSSSNSYPSINRKNAFFIEEYILRWNDTFWILLKESLSMQHIKGKQEKKNRNYLLLITIS